MISKNKISPGFHLSICVPEPYGKGCVLDQVRQFFADFRISLVDTALPEYVRELFRAIVCNVQSTNTDFLRRQSLPGQN